MDYKNYIKNLLKSNNKQEILSTNKKTTSETLVDILEENINNFSFKSKEDISYLFVLFDILEEFLLNNQNLQASLATRFFSIHNSIKMIIQDRPKEMNKNEEKNIDY